jgi:hypothetical protein
MKTDLKQKAILLRRQGKSYKEILEHISVSKSSLSLWLKEVVLTYSQVKKLQEKRIKYANIGAQKRKTDRITKTKEIMNRSSSEIGPISSRELFLLGVVMYWSEGAKQKTKNVSQRVTFTNSDPRMVKIFLLWLDRICHISTDDQRFELYIHENGDIEGALKFWKRELNTKILPIRLKKHKVKVGRNVSSDYKGLIRVTVVKSTDLNRRISGWIKGITDNWGVV